MNELIFQPWMGKDYGDSEYGKLLIIGDSHYIYDGDSDYPNYTRKVMDKLGNDGDTNFHKRIGQIFNQDNHLEVWPKVAFANAIQHPFDNA